MWKLLQTFIDIALWRKGPQDLPASRFLLLLALFAYVAASFIQVHLANLRLRTAFAIVSIDVAMMMLWLWAVLAFFGRRQRFIQTLTAMLGVCVLLAALDIVVGGVQALAGAPLDESSAGLWLLLRLMALALIMGRIFMHALERGLLTCMALTVAIVYSTGAMVELAIGRLQG